MKPPSTLLPTHRVIDFRPPLSPGLVFVFAVACGLSVANIYYAQPLLDAMAAAFSIRPSTIGLVITFTQAGYGLGLLFIVPLGDLIDRRRLLVGQFILSAMALAVVGSSSSALVLMSGMMAVGLLAVAIQVIVAFAATLAAPAERGHVVGTVTSGVVIGILAARAVSGLLADLAGWRAVYFVSAGLMLVMAGLLFRILPEYRNPGRPGSYLQLMRSLAGLLVEEPLLRLRAAYAFLIFASFSILWTSMVLPLSSPPLSLPHTVIGLFGLAGIAGALGASRAGSFADRGWGQWTTGISFALLAVSWWPMSYLFHSLAVFVFGIILLDLAVQAVHVTNQTLIFALRPEARTRLVAVYMAFYSIGSAAGSIASTLVYAHAGWTGVCVLGAVIGGLGLALWALTVRHEARLLAT